jgi:phospholipase D1/2
VTQAAGPKDVVSDDTAPDTPPARSAARPAGDLQVLVTAQEAYPVLERAFLNAEHRIIASFRIFDPTTKLRSPEAQEVGETWLDLIVHTLRRGVDFDLALSDFDPLLAHDLHRQTWWSLRLLSAARELAGPGSGNLRVIPALHSARIGFLPRLLFWTRVCNEVSRTAGSLNELEEPYRRTRIKELPGLACWLMSHTDGTFAAKWLPVPTLVPATHHQKLAVFDGRRTYIGGLDLDERRYDSREHRKPGHLTWQDVQLMIDDPKLGKAAEGHLGNFISETGGRSEPPPRPPLLRTLSAPRKWNIPFLSPRRLKNEIARAHFHEIKQSKDLIYLETQFFRDRGLARRLARAARRNPKLGLILILPAAPEDVAFENRRRADSRYGEFLQARALRIIRRAYKQRLFVGSPAQTRSYSEAQSEEPNPDGRDRLAEAPLIYVHTKVSIFDERAAIVSSANLNGRSLYWDTEAGVRLDRPEDVAQVKRKVMSAWLPRDADNRYYTGSQAVQAWRMLANENLVRRPEGRRCFILPYADRPARRFGRALPGVPEEMV